MGLAVSSLTGLYGKRMEINSGSAGRTNFKFRVAIRLSPLQARFHEQYITERQRTDKIENDAVSILVIN